jgi:Undecaprenyl-phosphate galactose phosphotransferase WbaP
MKKEILFQDPIFFSKNTSAGSLRHRRMLMSAILAAGDITSISISILAAIAIWEQVRSDLQVHAHLSLIPTMVIFLLLTYRLMVLYPGIGIGPVEELKRLTTGTSFVVMAMIVLSFFLQTTATYSRATLLMSWWFMLMGVPLSRKVFRRLAVKFGVWGIPVAVAGDAEGVIRIQKRLSLHPLSGLWPVLCLDGLPAESEENVLLAPISTLILVTDQGSFEKIHHLVTNKSYQFKRILLILDETKIGPLWFTPINIAEHIGLEVANNLINPAQQWIKRLMEIGIIILFMPLLVILFACIAGAIRLGGSGPILYRHKRVGYGGKDLWIWKFRTMVDHADAELVEHLQGNPALQKEWNENFKLKNDPRITVVGRLLRITSLDELPQIWNVLNGEMTLIGPRPIVQEEIPLYGKDFEIYKQVHPGMTGLWQISGRNDLPYQERVALDVYYIQSWSIWLDIHILVHTFLATLLARGAY